MTTGSPPRRSIFRIATITVAILGTTALMALLALAVLRADTSGIDGALSQGKPAEPPTFDLEVLTEGTLRLELRGLAPRFADGRITNEELLGTPVVLNLWASWCSPCRDEAPDLKAVSESASAEGVLFLGLNSLDGRSAARKFARAHRLRYPNVREYDNATSRAFGASGLPETFFLSADGMIVGHVIGAISATQLTDGIRAARTGRPIAAQAGTQRRGT